TGGLWIADVGQDKWEEVDLQKSTSIGGENYGWRCKEASYDFNSTNCTTTQFIDPVFEYENKAQLGCSITGGFVYRGAKYKSLFGNYWVTDYCSGNIWKLNKTPQETIENQLIGTFSKYNYVSFGQDTYGELYLCERETGKIVKLTTNECKPVAAITQLNDTLVLNKNEKINAVMGNGLSYTWFYNTEKLPETSTSLLAEKAGNYQLVVANAKNCADTFDFHVSGIIDNLPKTEPELFKIYPNPAQGSLTVELAKTSRKKSTLRVISANGAIVKTVYLNQKNEILTLNINNLTKGFYLVEYNNGTQIASTTLSVN
ncbi:MAG: T9SS type A sorting domain-containing protein, partial [Bacteroidia bacterium]